MDAWDGWYFSEDFIIDPAGNKYNQRDINSLFFERQVTEAIRGDKHSVLGLADDFKTKN